MWLWDNTRDLRWMAFNEDLFWMIGVAFACFSLQGGELADLHVTLQFF